MTYGFFGPGHTILGSGFIPLNPSRREFKLQAAKSSHTDKTFAPPKQETGRGPKVPYKAVKGPLWLSRGLVAF